MPAETFDHVDTKHFVWLAFLDLVAVCDQEFQVLGDGATVPIDDNNANEPDTLVYAGSRRPGSSLEIRDPVIVVEVLSPTSVSRDKTRKRRDYFSLPSVQHYLVVDPETRTALHFDRSNYESEGRLLTESDDADLAPTGFVLPIRRCFSRT